VTYHLFSSILCDRPVKYIYAIDLFINRDQKAEAKQKGSSVLWLLNKTFNYISNKLKREETERIQQPPGGKIMGGD